MRHRHTKAATWVFVLTAVATAALATSGCGGIGLAYDQCLVKPYHLIAVDSMSQMMLAADSDDIPADSNVHYGSVVETVYAVGWTREFIIAKQHPAGDRSITHYFIVHVASGNVSDALDADAFAVERVAAGVPAHLDFTLTFDEFE